MEVAAVTKITAMESRAGTVMAMISTYSVNITTHVIRRTTIIAGRETK